MDNLGQRMAVACRRYAARLALVDGDEPMALDLDLLIEGAGTDDKREFLERAREDGLRSAIVWRDTRFKDD
jgi:hypothetical protein